MSKKSSVFVLVQSSSALTGQETINSPRYTRAGLGDLEIPLRRITAGIGKISAVRANRASSKFEIIQSFASHFLAKFRDGVVLYFDDVGEIASGNTAERLTIESPRFAFCWCPNAEKLYAKLEKIFIRIRDEKAMNPILIIITKDALFKSKNN